MTEQKKSGISKPLAVGIAVLVLVLVAIIVVLLMRKLEAELEDGDIPKVGYAAEGVMVLDDDGIYDVLEPNSIALEFKNDAYSKDGKIFACYLGNSALNEYDMYVAIYSDAELTDLLYMSGLVRPGNGFEQITLDKELELGDHRVYVAFTQMEDPSTIHAQTIFTMDFHVLPN